MIDLFLIEEHEMLMVFENLLSNSYLNVYKRI